MITTVANRPVEFAVGPPGEAVEIMAGEADADAKTIDERFNLLCFSVVVGILEAVNARNHCEVDGAVFFNESAGGASEWGVEITTINSCFVRDAIAIGVFK